MTKKINKCDGCCKLNKKRKSNPCEINFNVIYDKVNKIFIRPNKCKKKILKIDPKKETRRYKDRAIDAFQMWIRYRDNWKCCCCGFQINPKEKDAKKLLHAGHFISRKFETLLLDEKNVHAQCRTCNGMQDWLGINPKYIIYLFNKYGLSVFEYFYNKMNNKKKYTSEEWKQLAIYWETKLEEIKKDYKHIV